MGGFYNHQKSRVVGDYETKWILIYSSSREKLIGCHQAIDEMRSDNDSSSSELSINKNYLLMKGKL